MQPNIAAAGARMIVRTYRHLLDNIPAIEGHERQLTESQIWELLNAAETLSRHTVELEDTLLGYMTEAETIRAAVAELQEAFRNPPPGYVDDADEAGELERPDLDDDDDAEIRCPACGGRNVCEVTTEDEEPMACLDCDHEWDPETEAFKREIGQAIAAKAAELDELERPNHLAVVLVTNAGEILAEGIGAAHQGKRTFRAVAPAGSIAHRFEVRYGDTVVGTKELEWPLPVSSALTTEVQLINISDGWGYQTAFDKTATVPIECRDHPLDQHDSLLDPEGCGHCNDCHNGVDHNHDFGCPGC